MDSVCSWTWAQLSSLLVPAPALLAPWPETAAPSFPLPRDMSPPSMVDPWLQTRPRLLSQTGEAPSPSWPLCCSDHSNKASWRGAGAPSPPGVPVGGTEEVAVPALHRAFPGPALVVPGVHPAAGAEPCPHGDYGDAWRRCPPAPHLLQSGAAQPSLRALLVFGSPLDNLLWTTCPGNGARKPGSE